MCVAEEVTAVGVPLISPVDVLSERPAGSEGDTEKRRRSTAVGRRDGGHGRALVNVNEFGL